MSNLLILYFTLGALVGLPLGYGMAAVWYEELQPILARAIAYALSLNHAVQAMDAWLCEIEKAGR